MEDERAFAFWIFASIVSFFVHRHNRFVDRLIESARWELSNIRKKYTIDHEADYFAFRHDLVSSYSEESTPINVTKHIWLQRAEIRELVELRRAHARCLIFLRTIYSSKYGPTRMEYVDELPFDEEDDVVFDLRMKYMLFGREKKPLIFIPMYVRHELFMLSYFGNDLLRRIPT